MRYPSAQLGYVGMVLAVLGTAAAAAISLQASPGGRPSLDADIDRIVAQQLEKRRLATSADAAEVATPVKAALGDTTADDDTTGALPDAGDAPDKASRAAHNGKRPVRGGRLPEGQVFPALMRVPKAAVGTAANLLLRFR